MRDCEPYPSYSDSGVAWLGRVPSDWVLVRGKFRFRTQKNINRDLECLDRLALTMGGVVSRSITENEGLQPADFRSYQIFEANDLVFKLIDLENFKTSRVGLVPRRGIMSPAYIRLTAESELDPRFFYHQYFDLYLRGIYNEVGGQGVRSAINASDLLDLPILAPSLPEQMQIAKFLDYETAKIDALIERQQQLIRLLDEKRQAVVSHAVTNGLDPDAPMRETGVPWAPLVPAHWSLTPNRSVLRIRKELVGRRHSSYRLLSLTKRGVLIRDMSTGEGKHSDHLDRCQEVRPGDLVFCLFDVEETPRTVGLSKHLGMISGDYTVFECADPLAGRFLEYFYKAMDDRKLLSFLYRGLRKRIPKPGFLSAKTPMPPPDEQEAIVRYLDDVGEKLAKLGGCASDQVGLLQERRAALFSAAVTGKIDVRNWKAPESKTEANVA